MKIFVDDHANGAEGRGAEPDDELDLDDERVGDGAARRVACLAELHGGQQEPVERGGAQHHAEPGAVLRRRHPRGPVPSGVHPQHGRADREQHHGVHRGGREPLPHEQQREGGREHQLRGEKDRGGGHWQIGLPVRVEEVVDAGHDADGRRRGQESRRHEEELAAAAMILEVAAAAGEGGAERDEEQRPAGGLEQAGEPLAGAAVDEVCAEEQRAARRAGGQEDEVDHQERVRGGADRELPRAGLRCLALLPLSTVLGWHLDLHVSPLRSSAGLGSDLELDRGDYVCMGLWEEAFHFRRSGI